jgi:hypothetical protein
VIDIEAKVLRVVKFMGWEEDGSEHLTLLSLAQEIRRATIEEMEKRDGRAAVETGKLPEAEL